MEKLEFNHDGTPKQENQNQVNQNPDLNNPDLNNQDLNSQEANKSELPKNETENQTEPKEEKTVRTKRKTRFARKVADILADGWRVLTNWKLSPYVLHSLPKEEFEETLTKLKEEYEKQSSVTPNINSSQIKLGDIRKRTKLGASKIKHTLKGKYPVKEAEMYYTEFGIEHTKRGYLFPTDRESMLLALEKMLSAIVAHGLAEHEFGQAYWQEIQTELLDLTPNVDTQDVSKSKHTGNLQKYKELAQTQLRCIAKLVEAENPEDPDRALMNMGFFRRN